MDKIYIKDLEVYGYHGVNIEEKNMGQRFLISLELDIELRKAGISDNLNDTVNYAEICYKVEDTFLLHKYDLIEKAAEEVAKTVLINFDKINKVKVLLKKPWAPIGKPLGYAAIEIERRWHTVFISAGSNMGDKKRNIEDAIDILNNREDCKAVKMSQFYETQPVGYLDQDTFVNCAFEIKTLLPADELMVVLLDVEKELKRERVIRYGPRTLDLDIIFYDDIITSDREVIIPHPRAHERQFVMKPLSDIAPYYLHPLLNKRVIDLSEELGEDF
ncbi:MAG: 2-amino-4-hydroxy-6-hydroxymethyldihydropteridine diphosphokinase [Clostridiaceae bacterium]